MSEWWFAENVAVLHVTPSRSWLAAGGRWATLFFFFLSHFLGCSPQKAVSVPEND